MTTTAKFLLRLDANLKTALERLAEADDRSLNNYVVRVLAQHVANTEPRKGKGK